MSKRYKVKRFNSCYSMNWVDNKTNKELTALEVEEILHKQENRIAELEEQLKKAIVPKFKIGQKSYYIFDDVVGFFKPEKVCEVRDVLILGIQLYEQGTQYQTTYGLFNEDTLFATKEEAQAKLEELKGES